MIEISEFYKNKSHFERKKEVLNLIIECETLLKSDGFTLIGGGCLMVAQMGSVCSSIKLAPSLSDQCYEALKETVGKQLIALKKLDKQIDQEKENED